MAGAEGGDRGLPCLAVAGDDLLPSRASRARRVTTAQAAAILADRDPVIAGLVAKVGPPRFRRPLDTPFAALVRAIVYQQLAGAAAATIHGRLLAALDGDASPESLLSLSDEAMRAAGLSANKAASLRDLALKVTDGTVAISSGGLARESDDEIVDRLSSVRGIGRWTAEMFLLFQLRRPDVWPTGDLGVRRGYGLAWGVAPPSPNELEPLGEPYRPYRSVAAWYCWRAVELYANGADGGEPPSPRGRDRGTGPTVVGRRPEGVARS
jgi:DNA-3-methyladenine glycosylase II